MAADRLFYFFKTSGSHDQFDLLHADTFAGIFIAHLNTGNTLQGFQVYFFQVMLPTY
nr:hypothetical protein [Escherichia albertii]